ncbi:MAG: hypothetical protein Ct9H90mP5_02890 [Acidimicrobiaceae bacterium]|nr:MAG: hypothetical protein Ct9H90mP5_02890 [Acidimicrobiaceae bacterium]
MNNCHTGGKDGRHSCGTKRRCHLDYLNRPERLNSYGRQTVDEIILTLRENMDARVGVITGNGRAFCAGGFLGNLAKQISGM